MRAESGEEEGVIELAPRSLTRSLRHSWRRCSTFNPFLSSRRLPRFINGSFSLSVFLSLHPTPRRAVAGCEIECHGLKTALENVSIVNCSRRSYKKSRLRLRHPAVADDASYLARSLPRVLLPWSVVSSARRPSSACPLAKREGGKRFFTLPTLEKYGR